MLDSLFILLIVHKFQLRRIELHTYFMQWEGTVHIPSEVPTVRQQEQYFPPFGL